MSLKTKYTLSHLDKTILLVFGLPNSGKTTLCEAISRKLLHPEFVYLNADKVRSTLSKDLGFSADDRKEQARRMGCMASLVLDGSAARLVMVDFVNPNIDTWTAFRENLNRPVGKQRVSDVNRTPPAALEDTSYPCFSVFMNTINNEDCIYADTASLFARGERPVDLEFTKWEDVDLMAAQTIEALLEKQRKTRRQS